MAVTNNFKVEIADDILKQKTFKKTMSLIYPQSKNLKPDNFNKNTYLGKPKNIAAQKIKT